MRNRHAIRLISLVALVLAVWAINTPVVEACAQTSSTNPETMKIAQNAQCKNGWLEGNPPQGWQKLGEGCDQRTGNCIPPSRLVNGWCCHAPYWERISMNPAYKDRIACPSSPEFGMDPCPILTVTPKQIVEYSIGTQKKVIISLTGLAKTPKNGEVQFKIMSAKSIGPSSLEERGLLAVIPGLKSPDGLSFEAETTNMVFSNGINFIFAIDADKKLIAKTALDVSKLISTKCVPVLKNGDPSKKIDVVVVFPSYMMDGAAPVVNNFLEKGFNGVEPYKSNIDKFNVWYVILSEQQTEFFEAFELKKLEMVNKGDLDPTSLTAITTWLGSTAIGAGIKGVGLMAAVPVWIVSAVFMGAEQVVIYWLTVQDHVCEFADNYVFYTGGKGRATTPSGTPLADQFSKVFNPSRASVLYPSDDDFKVFIHEFGHQMGLQDEYIEVGKEFQDPRPNCAFGTPTAPWNDLIGKPLPNGLREGIGDIGYYTGKPENCFTGDIPVKNCFFIPEQSFDGKIKKIITPVASRKECPAAKPDCMFMEKGFTLCNQDGQVINCGNLLKYSQLEGGCLYQRKNFRAFQNTIMGNQANVPTEIFSRGYGPVNERHICQEIMRMTGSTIEQMSPLCREYLKTK